MASTCAASWRISSSASGALLRDDLDPRAVVERPREVADLAVHLDRERGAREALADRARGVEAGGAVCEFELRVVGQVDLHRGHRTSSDRGKPELVLDRPRDRGGARGRARVPIAPSSTREAGVGDDLLDPLARSRRRVGRESVAAVVRRERPAAAPTTGVPFHQVSSAGGPGVRAQRERRPQRATRWSAFSSTLPTPP